MLKITRSIKLVFGTIFLLMLAACGGGGGSAGTPLLGANDNSYVTIRLAANSASLSSGQSTALTATVTDAQGNAVANQAVTFSFSSNISGASLSATSANTSSTGQAGTLYTAGNLSGTDTVTATVTDSSGKVATASVTIAVQAATPQSTLKITLNAASTSLPSGQSTALTATVTDAQGNAVANQAVTFSFSSNISGASLSATSANTSSTGQAGTLYTAGNLSGTDTVTATVTDSNGKVATASVTIAVQAASQQSTLTVDLTIAGTGSSASIASGQSAVLTAIVKNAQTGTVVPNQTVAFAFSANISGAQLGSASLSTSANGIAAVLYTAGNQAGSDIVTATVTDSSGKVATASVTVSVQAQTGNYAMTVAPAGTQTVGPNTASTTAQVQTTNKNIPFTIAVTDSSGAVVPNLTVNSALGSANSAGIDGTVNVVPGFLTQSATVSPTLTNTTDVNGKAYPTYVSGGRAGTSTSPVVDTVIFTVVRNGIIIASQSVQINVVN